MLRQAQHGDAVALDRLHRHQMLGIDPMRHPEQGSAAMVVLAFRRQRRPGGVAQRFVQRFRLVFRSGYQFGEPNLGQRAADPGFQGGAQGGGVETAGVRVFLHRLALHEQAFAGMDRIERQGLVQQRRGFGLNSE